MLSEEYKKMNHDTKNYEKNFIYTGEDEIEVLSNNKLQCKDCVYRLKTVAVCKKYTTKPLYVLKKSSECEYYKSENN